MLAYCLCNLGPKFRAKSRFIACWLLPLAAALALSSCSDQTMRFSKDGVNTDYSRDDSSSQSLYEYPADDEIKKENLAPIEDKRPQAPKMVFAPPPALAKPLQQDKANISKPAAPMSVAPENKANKENKANSKPEKSDQEQASKPLIWPLRGQIVSKFGQLQDGRNNNGIDIAVPDGTMVKASAAGVVIYAGTELKEFGKTILIKHANGLVTVYGNNSEMLVKRGDEVKQGQIIAKSGHSGASLKSQLHFEVRMGAKPTDPFDFLKN